MITKEEYKEPEIYKIPTVTIQDAFGDDDKFYESFPY